jgi:hypothetical protein
MPALLHDPDTTPAHRLTGTGAHTRVQQHARSTVQVAALHSCMTPHPDSSRFRVDLPLRLPLRVPAAAHAAQVLLMHPQCCSCSPGAAHAARCEAAAADDQKVGVEAGHSFHVLVGLERLAQLVGIVGDPCEDAGRDRHRLLRHTCESYVSREVAWWGTGESEPRARGSQRARGGDKS